MARRRGKSGGQDTRGVLVARGVTKRYAGSAASVVALRDVDLRVERGEFVAVVGPSGSGKTTLLNCLAGLDTVDGGAVRIEGIDLAGLSERERARYRARRLGFVFQAYNLVPVLSAVENVELPLLFAGARPRQARQRASAMLDRVGLAARGDHRPGELSGGEQQRVAVARAVVTDPAIVWADEPTGNLDSRAAGSVLDLFRELHADGTTVLLVTHDVDVAAAAHRRVTMQDGRIVTDHGARVAVTSR